MSLFLHFLPLNVIGPGHQVGGGNIWCKMKIKKKLFLISNVCNSSSMCRNVDYYHFHGSFVTALPSSKKLHFK